MAITITDAKLIETLRQSQGDVNLVAADGSLLGTFVVGGLFRPPVGFKSKFSDEEIERRRKNNAPGRPLSEILRDLESKG